MAIQAVIARLEEIFEPGYTPNPISAHRRDGDSISVSSFSHREQDETFGLSEITVSVDVVISSDQAQEQGWSYPIRMAGFVDDVREVIGSADGPWREIDVVGSQIQQPDAFISLEVIVDSA